MKLKTNKEKNEVVNFLKELRKKQNELEYSEQIYFTNLTMYYVIKNKLPISKVLTHPCVLIAREIGEVKNIADNNAQAIPIIKNIIEYELTAENNHLERKELDSLIQFYNKNKS